MVSRKVRWNKITDTGVQEVLPHRYIVAVLNSPEEIKRIRQRFLDQMLPVNDITDLLDHDIPGSNGLHCEIFSFSSGIPEIQNIRKIYDNPSQFRKDRSLGEYSEERLITYALRISR